MRGLLLGAGLSGASKVWAVTGYKLHACLESTRQETQGKKVNGEMVDAIGADEREEGDDGGTASGDDFADFATTEASSSQSGGASSVRMRSHLRKRSLTAKQLKDALQPEFEQHQRRWKLPDVREKISLIDAGAASLAGAVLRGLRGVHQLNTATSTKLIQGLALSMRRRGWGVALHYADATAIREQALELARKRYYAEARRRKLGKVQRFSRDAVAQTLDEISEFVKDESGNQTKATYITGWTAIPPSQMANGYKNYIPVDAIDCAAMRGRCGGVAVVRAKKDANRRLHVVSMSHVLAAEGDLSVGGHMFAEKQILPEDAFNTSDYLTLFDGGASLKGQTRAFNPNASTMRYALS